MTEIEQYDHPATPAPVGAPPAPVLTGGAISMIREYTAAMDDAHRFASAICRSSFVPEHFRGKPEETALAILYGATVGFDPMTSAQQIFVIGGRPALYARAMVAVVVAAGHEVWTDEERSGYVTVAGRRKGSEHVTRVTWTSELAQQAGYTKNAKYKTDPRSMLYARASGDVARRIAPDALLGLAFNVEEMQLVPAAAEVQRPTPARSTARDQVAAAIAGPSPVAQNQPEPEVQEAQSDSITKAQTRKLHATFNEIGLTERDPRMAWTIDVIGRHIESSNDLTRDEAVKVIDALEAEVRLQAGQSETDPADVLWQRCITTAAGMDWSLDKLEDELAREYEGLTPGDATAEQLDAFLTSLEQEAA